MNEPHISAVDIHASAQERLAEIAKLFSDMKNVLAALIAELAQTEIESPKKLLVRMSDLQSAHLATIRAEEAFHEKYASVSDVDDIANIRSEIGGQLDRIRAALDAETVSKVAEQGSDTSACG